MKKHAVKAPVFTQEQSNYILDYAKCLDRIDPESKGVEDHCNHGCASFEEWCFTLAMGVALCLTEKYFSDEDGQIPIVMDRKGVKGLLYNTLLKIAPEEDCEMFKRAYLDIWKYGEYFEKKAKRGDVRDVDLELLDNYHSFYACN